MENDTYKMICPEPNETRYSEAVLRYRTLFDQSPDGILIIDTEGKICEFNEAAHRTLGYSREEFAKLSIFDIEAQETPDETREHIKRVLNSGRAEFEVSHRARSGEIRNTRVITQTLVLGTRTVLHTVWKDITEPKRAAEELRKSEEKYRDLFENAIDPIVTIDADLNYVDVNKRAVELFGYSREELLSMSILDVIPPEQVPRSQEEFEKLRERGAYEKFEGKLRKKDGTYIDIQVSSSAIYENGKFVGSRDIVRDITDKKLAEEALCRAKDDLEIRVNERTRELAERNRELQREIEERMKAESELQKSKELSDKLNDIDAVIHSMLDFDAILQSVTVEGSKAIGVDAAVIGVYRDDSFVVQHVHNLPLDLVGKYFPSEDLKGIRYATTVRDVVAYNDAANDTRLNLELVQKLGIRSMMIAPLTIKRNVLGALGFLHRSSSVKFAEMHIDFARKLSASISLALENATLYEGRRIMEEHMQHMAHHDNLTGLPNRRLLTDIINYEISERRNRKKLAILFLDLDRFKEINDTLGHEAGDELLKKVAERLKACIRETDALARIGGDEFNILFTHFIRAEDITLMTQKIMNSFRDSFLIGGHELHVSTSIGISVYPDDSEDVNTLFRYADIAMYHAKGLGRNTYHFYNNAINIQLLEKIKMENELSHALERDQLLVHYQPQVDIKTLEIVCAEALVRWQHPKLGLIESKRFISIAEQTGLVNAIDQWVLRTACAQFVSWQDSGRRPYCVAVNISAKGFQNPDLVGFISRTLKETGMSSRWLEIEITESTAMSDIEQTIARLRELSAMGVRLTIDDFGTGYSSLSYLKRLPFQRLKIDQSFMTDIPTDPDDKVIIQAVIAMAHKMKMRVVAEGVENKKQLSFLHSTHCDEAQGYLFNKALPPEQLRELMPAAIREG